MKKYRVIALLLTCCMLTACGNGAKILTSPEIVPTEQGTEVAGLVEPGISGTLPEQVTGEEALWNFSHSMLQENIGETNPVLSPVSAYLAMGMVGLGAKGETLAEFENVMSRDMQTISGNLMQAIPTWIQDSSDEEKKATLDVANSVWVDNDMNPSEEWLASVSDIYAAEVYQGDLSGSATMKDINDWVEEKTHSLIKKFLSRPLEAETRLALFNTIYFYGEWANKFEATSTYKEDFTTTAGDVKKVDMMHDYGRTEFYVESQDMDGVVMDYRDGSMALVALKPTAGQTVREMYEQLTYEDLAKLLDNGSETLVNLKLPKFEVEFDRVLNETIQSMGIRLAFDSELADFTGLGTTTNGNPLCISLVRQKAVVKLDEEGTEAAAVTMVVMVESAAAEPVQTPIEVFFDEPFLYMIMDMESKTPLFMGIMDEPVH